MVETGISVICSSMPAMAGFSRSLIFQSSAFTSLLSLLPGGHSSSKNSKLPSYRNMENLQDVRNYKKDPADSESISALCEDAPAKSFQQIQSFKGLKTEITGASSKSDLENEGIQMSVMLEQSSERSQRNW